MDGNGLDDARTARATAPLRLPDFIIGGAPKCGTTSIHFILDQHPAIGLPDGEIHFFDADDPVTHPDFVGVRSGRIRFFDPNDASGRSLDWYRHQFEAFAEKPLIGEDSTTYVFSPVAPRRMAALLPEVKLIFMLRHPVKRAYSQYWHLLTSGRTSLSFERALSRFPGILMGSTYTHNLLRYFEAFPASQIRVVLFEDFIADQQGTIDGLCDFLGAERMSLETARTWFNRTLYPTSPRAQRLLNLIGRPVVSTRYRTHMLERADWSGLDWLLNKLHYRYFRNINPLFLKAERPPAMRADTRAYLERHLSDRNAGLSDLLGRDITAAWDGIRC